MERDGQLELYDLVAARLKEAHRRVRTMQVSESERAALSRRLLAVTAASKHDLAAAARRLNKLMEELDESGETNDGRFPSA
ncbi:SCO5555 family protein [Streptomyces sparsus]